MSGDKHACIGMTLAGAVGGSMLYGSVNNFSKSGLVVMVAGSLLGSLIVDIDSKKSKASQKFNQIFLYSIIGILTLKFAGNYIQTYRGFLDMLFKSLGSTYNTVTSGSSIVVNYFGAFMFIVVTILGKLSPHREFTHKWFGTSIFLVVGYITFNKLFFIGYSIGYIAHILADKTTPAGIDFLDFKLPCKNSKGSWKVCI